MGVDKSLTAFGETKILRDWLIDPRCRIQVHTLYRRVRAGTLSPEDIISLPDKGVGGGNRTHGETRTRLHTIWTDMKQRCSNPNAINYSDYGGRGIGVCAEWQDSYITFSSWAKDNGYADDLTIDRKDTNGNYTPGNCQWVNRSIQQHNLRKNRNLTAFGETKTLREWARDLRCRVGLSSLANRLSHGWEDQRAIETSPIPKTERL